MSNNTPFLDGSGTFNALASNAGTIKFGSFNNAATNTGAVAVSAVFAGTAVNQGIIGNILPIETATLVASNSAAWDSTHATVSNLSATWNSGGGGGAVDLADISTASATWDAAYAYVSNTSASLVETTDPRLTDARAPISHTHAISSIDGLQTALDNKQASGSYATLENGKVPAAQLPSYVDDVVEHSDQASFPVAGDTGIIYVALDSNKTYRWSGSAYVEISPSPGSTDSVTEGATNLYFTNARATTALSPTIAALSSAIDGKQASGSYASATHAHAIADVTGLQTTINDLSASIAAGAVGDFAAVDDARLLLVGTSSANWDSVYASVVATSGTWNASGSQGAAQAGSVFTTVNANSATWATVTSKANASHTHTAADITNFNASVDARLTVLSSNSASWNSSYTTLNTNSAAWASNRTTVNSNSASWSSAYTTTNTNSATWATVTSKANASHTHTAADITGTLSVSQLPQTLVNTTSASWTNAYTTLTANSGNWGSSYTTTNTNSASWSSAYTTTNTNSATWATVTSKANASHTHAIADVTSLQTTINSLSSAIDGKQASGSYASTTHTHAASSITDFNTAADARIAAAAGVSVASLVGGFVPAAQLPSYVDDVLEYAALASFPAAGSTGIIYVALDSNKTYRWSGSAYVEISPSPGSTDSVTEGATNLYFTNARAVAATSATYAATSHTHTASQITDFSASVDARLTVVNTNSASWGSGYTTTNSNSSTWSSTYTTVNSNSASWSNVNTNFASLTAGSVSLSSAMLSTYNTPVTASGDFIVVTVGTKKRLIRLWDYI